MRIGALLHSTARGSAPETYILFALGELWREQGHEFDVIYGPDADRAAACDVLFNHVDLTRVPAEYHLSAPLVINAGACSVAKRDISEQGITSAAEWDGPVIVKTQRNHGGLPENTTKHTPRWTRWRRRLVDRGWLGLRFADMINPHRYPIFDSAREVPPGVWSNRHLVVEKFVPERDGDFYVLRNVFFLGDQVHCHRMLSRSPNVRTVSSERIEPLPVPADFESLRARSGLEYGKLDYIQHEGRSILIDATRTPCFSRPAAERRMVAATIAPGLEAMLAAHGRKVTL